METKEDRDQQDDIVNSPLDNEPASVLHQLRCMQTEWEKHLDRVIRDIEQTWQVPSVGQVLSDHEEQKEDPRHAGHSSHPNHSSLPRGTIDFTDLHACDLPPHMVIPVSPVDAYGIHAQAGTDAAKFEALCQDNQVNPIPLGVLPPWAEFMTRCQAAIKLERESYRSCGVACVPIQHIESMAALEEANDTGLPCGLLVMEDVSNRRRDTVDGNRQDIEVVPFPRLVSGELLAAAVIQVMSLESDEKQRYCQHMHNVPLDAAAGPAAKLAGRFQILVQLLQLHFELEVPGVPVPSDARGWKKASSDSKLAHTYMLKLRDCLLTLGLLDGGRHGVNSLDPRKWEAFFQLLFPGLKHVAHLEVIDMWLVYNSMPRWVNVLQTVMTQDYDV